MQNSSLPPPVLPPPVTQSSLPDIHLVCPCRVCNPPPPPHIFVVFLDCYLPWIFIFSFLGLLAFAFPIRISLPIIFSVLLIPTIIFLLRLYFSRRWTNPLTYLFKVLPFILITTLNPDASGSWWRIPQGPLPLHPHLLLLPIGLLLMQNLPHLFLRSRRWPHRLIQLVHQ